MNSTVSKFYSFGGRDRSHDESKCSFIIKDSLSTGSCTEWYVRCKELNLAWMDSAPCSPRRPNPTYVLFGHGTVCSSSMCIFNVIEQSGKELLKCSMSWAVIVSIGLCTVISYMYLYMHAR